MTKRITVHYRSLMGRIADAALGREYDLNLIVGKRHKYDREVNTAGDISIRVGADSYRDVKKLDATLKRFVRKYGYSPNIRLEGNAPEFVEIMVNDFAKHAFLDREKKLGPIYSRKGYRRGRAA